jgi:glutamate 5-kinase
MATKIEAARVLMKAGIPMVVCDGCRDNVVVDAVAGKPCGTMFSPGEGYIGAREVWIALGRNPAGEIVGDEGGKRALLERQTSLLPAGVVSVSGVFAPGDAVVLADREGVMIGRGLSEVSASDLELIKGMKTPAIAERFPHLAGKEVVHRDRLVIL